MDKAEMEDRRDNGDEDKGDEDEAQNEMDRFWTRFGGDHACSSTQPTKSPRRGDRRRSPKEISWKAKGVKGR